MIVLDASVLIGYLDGSDAHHADAHAMLVAAAEDEIGVNALTLAEVLVVPARDGRLTDVLDLLREIEIAELAFPTDTAPRLAHLRATTGLKMPDCCVLLSAEVTKGSVASFDERVLRAARTRGLGVVAAVT